MYDLPFTNSIALLSVIQLKQTSKAILPTKKLMRLPATLLTIEDKCFLHQFYNLYHAQFYNLYRLESTTMAVSTNIIPALYDNVRIVNKKIKWLGNLEELKVVVANEIEKDIVQNQSGNRRVGENGALKVMYCQLHGRRKVKIYLPQVLWQEN